MNPVLRHSSATFAMADVFRPRHLAWPAVAALLLAPMLGNAEWQFQNPRPSPYTFFSVSYLDQNQGLAGSAAGGILKTTDGGNNWTPQQSGLTVEPNINHIQFIDAQTAVAVGGTGLEPDAAHPYGVILRSIDGGATWTTQLDTPNTFVSDVHFRDVANGVAVGLTFDEDLGILAPMIWNTSDGGVTWTSNTLDTVGLLLGMAFSEPDIGVAVGGDLSSGTALILQTVDGGLTWQQQTSSTIFSLNGVAFADANNGIAVGAAGVVLTTMNGGGEWTEQDSGTQANLYGVSFTDAGIAVAAGAYNTSAGGVILRSEDGGVHWSNQAFEQNLYAVDFGDAYKGSAVGEAGEFLNSSDGGATWNEAPSSTRVTRNALFAISYDGNETGTAVGQTGTILRTTDGGNSWAIQTEGSLTNLNLLAVSTPDENFGMAVGGDIFTNEGVTLVTTDGGATWTDRTPDLQDLPTPTGVSCPVAGNCTAVGNCFPLHTSDAGLTWEPQGVDGESGCTLHLSAVDMVDTQNGTAVGLETLLRTTNGGANWTRQVIPTTHGLNLTTVSFADPDHGIAGGVDFTNDPATGVLLHTDDGGATWSVQRDDVGPNVTAVSMSDADHAFATTLAGEIYKTSDAGTTWSVDRTISANLYGVKTFDGGTARVVGWTEGFGVTLRDSDVPFQVGLHSSEASVCTSQGDPLQTTIAVTIASSGLSSAPVTVSSSGEPQGISSTFSPSTIDVPGSTAWTLTSSSDSMIGDYVVRLSGIAGTQRDIADLRLHVRTPPQTPALVAPGDAQVEVGLLPTFRWDVSAAVRLQVSTDNTFAALVIDAETNDDGFTPNVPLLSGTQYFWRVQGTDGCPGAWSATFSFTTAASIFRDGFERSGNGIASVAPSGNESTQAGAAVIARSAAQYFAHVPVNSALSARSLATLPTAPLVSSPARPANALQPAKTVSHMLPDR